MWTDPGIKIGMVCGDRTVVERLPDGAGGRVSWLLECKCGNRQSVESRNVVKSKSCRACAPKHRDKHWVEIGQLFGSRTVIANVGVRKGGTHWLVECKCGKRQEVRTCGLTNADVCRDCAGKAKKLKDDKFITEYRAKHIANGARQRNISFGLTIEQTVDLMRQCCHYCGVPSKNTIVSRSDGIGRNFASNGLDRIDNAAGYEPGNVVPCCRRCNVAKNNMSYGEFRMLIASIAAHWLDRKPDHKPAVKNAAQLFLVDSSRAASS